MARSNKDGESGGVALSVNGGGRVVLRAKGSGPVALKARMGERPEPQPSVPTARDYIQDGLVAMWDGIENAGWGVHDGTATTWKNLIGGIADITKLAGTQNWVSNGLSVRAGTDRWASNINTFFQNRNQFTLEVVAIPVSFYKTGANRLISNTESGGMSITVSDTGWVGASIYVKSYLNLGLPIGTATLNKGLYVSVGKTSSSVFLTANDNTITQNVSGNMARGALWLAVAYEPNNNGTLDNISSFGGVNGSFHCIRLYNRALTEQEIAANRKIDKARFNLP